MELGYANCQRASAKPVIKHFRQLPTVRQSCHMPVASCHLRQLRVWGCRPTLPVASPLPATLPVAMAIYDTEMLSDSPKLHMRKMLKKVFKKSLIQFTVT